MGTGRPVARYTYDQYNNVVAYCEPQYVWTTGATTCNPGSGVTHYTWNYSDSNEPYGYLTDAYTPLGYHHAIAYNTSLENGDYGLPTSVTSDSISQLDGTVVTPEQQFVYDPNGNLTCYSKLSDSSGTHWWRLMYDSLNRKTAAADPDDASLQATVSCPSSAAPGIAGSHIVNTTSYYLDGEVSATQSPSEFAAGVSTTSAYDADGNLLSTTNHFGNVAGTTVKWYDGADRLVEVQMPHDPSDYYAFSWSTRYLYDLSKNGAVAVANSGTFYAHGDLFKTQEYLNTSPYTGWTDIKGTSYDALDRQSALYQYSPDPSRVGGDVLRSTTLTYDTNSQTYGLLGQKVDAMSEVTTFSYDADARVTSKTYAGDSGVTPSQTTTYDPNGRIARIQSPVLGTQSYTYDSDGRLVQSVEPASLPSAATLTYAYYADGSRSGLSISSSALNQSNLLQYVYRADGRRTALTANYGNTIAHLSWVISPSGRMQSVSDNSGQPARTVSYNAYGQVASDSIPAGAYSNFAYDAEGEPTSYTAFGGVSVTQSYTARGELAQQVFSSFTPECGRPMDAFEEWQGQRGASANGYMQPILYGATQTGPTPVCGWSYQGQLFDPITKTNLGGDNPLTGNGSEYDYDADGRQNGAVQNYSSSTTCGDMTCDFMGQGSFTRKYDAENHLIAQSYTNWETNGSSSPTCAGDAPALATFEFSRDLSYVWGPSGHVVEMGADTIGRGGYSATGQTSYESLHYDGSELLFTTNALGAVDDIKIEGLADIIPGSSPSVVFLDRDYSGEIASSHGSSGVGAWTPPNPSRSMCNYSGPNVPVREPGPDGITDDYNVFQGVRTYDPQLGTWTTPDAYQGDVRDPISQRAYMWNRNNSIAYADPSGYVGLPNEDQSFPIEETAGMESWNARVDDQLAEQLKGQVEDGTTRVDDIKRALQNPKMPTRVRNILNRALRGLYGDEEGSTTGSPGARFAKALRAARLAPSCSACGSIDDLQGDHIKARAMGGGNTEENFDTLCQPCNGSKGSQTQSEWIDTLVQRYSNFEP